jgi:uncharacterized protein (DUF1015 family)
MNHRFFWCFKIFTKVAKNRLMAIAQKVINPTQTTLLPGRNIMEGVVIQHETMHEMHHKNRAGLYLKLTSKNQTIKSNVLL